jgi:hypothetical protein
MVTLKDRTLGSAAQQFIECARDLAREMRLEPTFRPTAKQQEGRRANAR